LTMNTWTRDYQPPLLKPTCAGATKVAEDAGRCPASWLLWGTFTFDSHWGMCQFLWAESSRI
jgi:hypothetical protein